MGCAPFPPLPAVIGARLQLRRPAEAGDGAPGGGPWIRTAHLLLAKQAFSRMKRSSGFGSGDGICTRDLLVMSQTDYYFPTPHSFPGWHGRTRTCTHPLNGRTLHLIELHASLRVCRGQAHARTAG